MARTGRPATRPETQLRQALQQLAGQPTNPIDQMIGKAIGKFKARYAAAGRGRRMAGWQPPTSGPNTALEGFEKLRERARDSSSNDWAGHAGVQRWTTALVGVGITPRFKGVKDKARREAITELYRQFVRTADADGLLDLYGLQTLAARTWRDGGECFIRRRDRFPDEGFVVPLQVQAMEGDMLPRFSTDARPGLPPGNVIRDGIEINKRGRRIAFWFYKVHPGDGETAAGSDNLVRILASEVIHIMEPRRPGQRRGVPAAAPILPKQRDLADFDDAVLLRQKMSNLFVAFIKKVADGMFGTNPGSPDLLQANFEGDPGSAADVPLGDSAPMGLQPGAVQVLEEGEDVTFSKPPDAGANYTDYMRTNNVSVASGVDLPYEIHSGDIRDVSDRTLRIAINEWRRHAEQLQWQILIPQMCQTIIEWFASASVLAGLIDATEYAQVVAVEHAPHGWPDIHPTQDIEGRAKAVEAGFRSRSSVIAAGGDDPERVDAERAEDAKREKQLGIERVVPPTNSPAPGQQQQQT